MSLNSGDVTCTVYSYFFLKGAGAGAVIMVIHGPGGTPVAIRGVPGTNLLCDVKICLIGTRKTG